MIIHSDPGPNRWPRDEESAIVTAERCEQDIRPERRSTASLRVEADYEEHGGLGNPEAYRLRNDLPEPADPWAEDS